MDTITRVKLPDKVERKGITYVFFSPLDRIGINAFKKGYPIIKVRYDSDKRKRNRMLRKDGRFDLMNNAPCEPSDYYYIAEKVDKDTINRLLKEL